MPSKLVGRGLKTGGLGLSQDALSKAPSSQFIAAAQHAAPGGKGSEH